MAQRLDESSNVPISVSTLEVLPIVERPTVSKGAKPTSTNKEQDDSNEQIFYNLYAWLMKWEMNRKRVEKLLRWQAIRFEQYKLRKRGGSNIKDDSQSRNELAYERGLATSLKQAALPKHDGRWAKYIQETISSRYRVCKQSSCQLRWLGSLSYML